MLTEGKGEREGEEEGEGEGEEEEKGEGEGEEVHSVTHRHSTQNTRTCARTDKVSHEVQCVRRAHTCMRERMRCSEVGREGSAIER